MPIIALSQSSQAQCRIPRFVEAIWINQPDDVCYYFEILVDNSEEPELPVNTLFLYSLDDLTGDVQPIMERVFPEEMNRAFPSDLSFTFFKDIAENRFLASCNADERTVEREHPYFSEWEIPKGLSVSQSLIGNREPRARGTLVTISLSTPILPGHRANLRMLFKRGSNPCVNELIRAYRKRWTNALITKLSLRSFDFEPLSGSEIRIENTMIVNDYILLVVLPPKAEEITFSREPRATIYHRFDMLSGKASASRPALEWRMSPQDDRPLRITGKYIEPVLFNWEMAALLFVALATITSLVVVLWLLVSQLLGQ